MQKTAFVRARIKPELKQQAEGVLEELGISPTQAITMLYKCIAREHAWPIELKIPTAETKRVMQQTDQGEDLHDAEDVDDLFEQLGVQDNRAKNTISQRTKKGSKTSKKKK